MRNGPLPPIDEVDDSSSNDSEEDRPSSHKKFPGQGPMTTRLTHADPAKVPFSGTSGPGVRPDEKSPFSLITNPNHSGFDTPDSSSYEASKSILKMILNLIRLFCSGNHH